MQQGEGIAHEPVLDASDRLLLAQGVSLSKLLRGASTDRIGPVACRRRRLDELIRTSSAVDLTEVDGVAFDGERNHVGPGHRQDVLGDRVDGQLGAGCMSSPTEVAAKSTSASSVSSLWVPVRRPSSTTMRSRSSRRVAGGVVASLTGAAIERGAGLGGHVVSRESGWCPDGIEHETDRATAGNADARQACE